MGDLKRDLIVGSATLVVITVVGAASFFAFREDEKRHQRLTTEVPADIIDVYDKRGTNPQTGATGGIVNVLVKYQYVIDGKGYSRNVTVGGEIGKSYNVGQPAKVCYNPRNQEEAELFPSNYKCGK